MQEVFDRYLGKVIIIERKNGNSETGKVISAHVDFLELENRVGRHSLVAYDQIGFIAEIPRKDKNSTAANEKYLTLAANANLGEI